ncbi:type IV pilus assembly protein PilM [Patescibacteria group bacterium]|nr:type IV pilus assembly protein PilM [Patescibacteria group bacterium]
MPLFQPQVQHLGLDISDRSLKLVQFKKNLKGFLRLRAYADSSVPAGVFFEGELKQPEIFQKILQQMLSQPKVGKFTSNNVVACLPETKTFIMTINLPPMPLSEMPLAVKWEAEHHIPIAIEETYWDWQAVGSIDTKTNKQTLLLGVIPKNIVDSYSVALKEVGLIPLAMEIEALAIARSVIAEQDLTLKQSALIIDFGATRTSLIVLDQQAIQFTVSLPISGLNITATLAKQLKMTEVEAEKAKIICGLDPKRCQGAIYAIMESAINELIKKIKESINYQIDHFPEQPVGQIILCGGGANFGKLDALLSKGLKLPVRKSNAWQYLSDDSPFNKEQLNSFATAIGLALRP